MTLPLPKAVLADTTNLRTRESMMLGASLEGGWGPNYAVGDNGTSFGPYQLHQGGMLTALGLTPQQASNAQIATKAMLPVYEQAVNQISDQKWQNDPRGAAAQAAFLAERPSTMYSSQSVRTGWQSTQAVLAGKKSTGGMPPQQATLTAAGNSGGNPLSFIPIIAAFQALFGGGSAIGGLKSDLARIGLVVFGATLVIVGIVIFGFAGAKSAVQEVGSTRRAVRGLSGPSQSGPSEEERQADRARRQDIANRSLALGQEKLALQRQRENRLAGNIN